jgi:integrase
MATLPEDEGARPSLVVTRGAENGTRVNFLHRRSPGSRSQRVDAQHRLPRPLTPEQDQIVEQELQRRNDLASNALLLLRHTGMRIGECVNLSFDCLRTLGPGRWAIHVPLGKLKTERLVPVDAAVCEVINRLRVLRPPDTPSTNRFLSPG